VADKCAWNMGTPCDGIIKEAALFQGQIKIPICEKHIKEHKIFMGLYKSGHDADEILKKSTEWREEEYNKLVESGVLDPQTIEL